MAERKPARKWHVGKTVECPSGNILTVVERLESPFVNVTCNRCHEDPELFPEPLKINLSHLGAGRTPCGCAKNPQWKEPQWKVLVSRACKEKDMTFLGWFEDYNGSSTRLKLLCNIHHTTNTGYSVTNFVNSNTAKGCRECRSTLTSDRQSKPDVEWIEAFKEKGSYPQNTSFSKHNKKLWEIECPICKNDAYSKAGCRDHFIASASDILRGRLSCRCSKSHKWDEKETTYYIQNTMEMENLGYSFGGFVEDYSSNTTKFYLLCPRGHTHEISVSHFKAGNRCYECANKNQRFAYIHIIKDSGTPIAIKYGIENLEGRRLIQQQSKTLFEVTSYGYWLFDEVSDCRAAEAKIKKEVGKRYLSKQEYPDGYTETLPTYKINEVINIYNEFGGTKL